MSKICETLLAGALASGKDDSYRLNAAGWCLCIRGDCQKWDASRQDCGLKQRGGATSQNTKNLVAERDRLKDEVGKWRNRARNVASPDTYAHWIKMDVF